MVQIESCRNESTHGAPISVVTSQYPASIRAPDTARYGP
jgi:hypothetical protein